MTEASDSLGKFMFVSVIKGSLDVWVSHVSISSSIP